jgi:hypothetical protein
VQSGHTSSEVDPAVRRRAVVPVVADQLLGAALVELVLLAW